MPKMTRAASIRLNSNRLPYFSRPPVKRPRPPATLAVGSHSVAVAFIRNPRARRYILRVDPNGALRVTLPARGSQTEAWNFVRRKTAWINERIERHLANPPRLTLWGHGTELPYRGDIVQLVIHTNHSSAIVEITES